MKKPDDKIEAILQSCQDMDDDLEDNIYSVDIDRKNSHLGRSDLLEKKLNESEKLRQINKNLNEFNDLFFEKLS